MSNFTGQSDVDRVRDATDLVQLIGEHVALKPKGREHVGLCPFHDDHKPSFAVVTHKGNAFYKCHACGEGGDAFDFVKNYHKMDFPDALRYLAERAGITLTPRRREQTASETSEGPSRADLRDANALAAEFFQRVLKSESAGKVGRDILEERGISAEMAEQFMIGLAPDQWDALLNVTRKRNLAESAFLAAGLLKNRATGGAYDAFRNRLIFPICNDLGQPVAFGARKINPEDEPKYLNSAESAVFQKSRTLYGLHLAKRAIIDAGQAVVTEGYTDVIACHQHGVHNVVGTLGTALTNEHAAMLSRLCHTVVLLFDGDEAGMRAADRGVEVFFAQPVDVRICVLPNGLDPDDLLRTHGAEHLRQLIADAQDALEFKVMRFRAMLDGAQGLSDRQKMLEGFLADLANLGFASMQGVRKRLVLTQLADLLAMPTHEIERAMPQPRKVIRPTSAADSVESPPHAHEWADAARISPARRRAEHDLLALLVFDPSIGGQAMDLEGEAGRVFDVFQPDNFLDETAKHIAHRVLGWLETGEAFTMQQLLGELPFEAAKQLASSLYFEGQQRCSEARSVHNELVLAAQTLLAHIKLDVYQQSVANFRRSRSDSPHADRTQEAMRIIEERRRQATIVQAIAVGVRSLPFSPPPQ